MSNSIALKKGLDIPVSGPADLKIAKTVAPDIVAIQPSCFKGLVPRLLVAEGDAVLAGSPVLADKNHPDILLTAPFSGTVKAVVRGDKRKLLAVLIEAGAEQSAVDFGAKDPGKLSADEVRKALLASGLWPALVQRPYGILADPAAKPKAVFVSAFATAPLAADVDFVLAGEEQALQAGVTALGKLTDGGVHVSVNGPGSPFEKLAGITLHRFSGKHPAGNVGIQISHIAPIRKDETVWTVSPVLLAAIGKLFLTGRLDLGRKVAVTGPAAKDPAYVLAFPGMPMAALAGFGAGAPDVRVVSGDLLSGRDAGADGYLGFFDNQVTLIREGNETELFGWAKPFRFNQFSATRSYFSRFLPKKRYDMDTNLHGGPRAFVMNDSYYADVLPMDLFPLYLVKACLAGNIDDMEKFGIYEVLPEDLALCEYIDPSKNCIQDIVSQGIDLMLKEMA